MGRRSETTFKGCKVSSWVTNTDWDTFLCPIREVLVLEQVGLAHTFSCAVFEVTWLEVSEGTQYPLGWKEGFRL